MKTSIKKICVLGLIMVGLSACSTLNIDKERATQQRKDQLCSEIETRDLPQCAGHHIPPPPFN